MELLKEYQIQKQLKNKFILLILLFSSSLCYSQNEIKPDIKKLEGYWVFTEGNFRDYICFRDNKKIEISFFLDSKEATIDGNNYGYFGFWDSSQHGDEEPKHVLQLETTGNIIQFYDKLGTDYDTDGNLLKKTRQCFLTINEDSDDPNPEVLRFYYQGTPDLYEKIKYIPKEVRTSLKKKPKYWKIYADFMGLVEKVIVAPKSIIFKSPSNNQPTKMYLIKGDEVEVLEEQISWLKIRYYGKIVIEGWIRKQDLR